MAISGKNKISIKKKDLVNSIGSIKGVKKVVFAHEAASGETGINLNSLVAPSSMVANGFSNPSPSDLASLNLYFNRYNLTLVSSLRGFLIQDLSYKVQSSTQIDFIGFTAADKEIFIGVVDNIAKDSVAIADAKPISVTGTLTSGSTDFNVGTPFKVGTDPQSVVVFRNGVLQVRNSANSSSILDGNYYEVDSGNGYGTIIRFNNAATFDESIVVISVGALVERPQNSTLAEIEKLAGQIDAMVPVLSSVSGVPETNFQSAPNNPDLLAFGNTVNSILDTQVPIVTDWQTYTPTWTNFTVGNAYQKALWRRVGDTMEIQIHVRLGTTSAVTGQIYFTPPPGYNIDRAKIATNYLGGWPSVGSATLWSSGIREVYNVILKDTTGNDMYMEGIRNDGAIGGWNSTFPVSWAANDEFRIYDVKVPIIGWTPTDKIRNLMP